MKNECAHNNILMFAPFLVFKCHDCDMLYSRRSPSFKGTYTTKDQVNWTRQEDDGKIHGVDAGIPIIDNCI